MFESWFGSLRAMSRSKQWDTAFFSPDELATGLDQSERGLVLAEPISYWQKFETGSNIY